MKKKWKIKIYQTDEESSWNCDIISPNGKVVWIKSDLHHKYRAIKNARSFIEATGADIKLEVVE